MKELIQKYNAWLEAHCTPQRTAAGNISKSQGRVRYELPDNMPMLLGGSYIEPAEKLRQGKDVPANVRRAVSELVDAWDIPAILRLRRDQAYARRMASARTHFKQFGHAPDGSTLESFARRISASLDRSYGTVPTNNLIRQQRHAA